MKFTLALLLFLTYGLTWADNVYTCTKVGALKYQDCGDDNTVITNSLQPSTLVAVVDGCQTGSSSFWYCPTMKWAPASTVTDSTLIGMCGGTVTTLAGCAKGNGGMSAVQPKSSLEGVTWVSGWVYDEPVCVAKDDEERRKYQAIPPRLIVAWYCDRPGGIQGYVRVMSFTDGIRALKKDIPFGLSSDQKRYVDKQATTRALTADEQADADAFLILARPIATVSPIAAGKRPVVKANPDRTVGAKTGQTIAVGQPCKYYDRLVAFDAGGKPVGTAYYAVAGGYAVCVINGAVSK